LKDMTKAIVIGIGSQLGSPFNKPIQLFGQGSFSMEDRIDARRKDIRWECQRMREESSQDERRSITGWKEETSREELRKCRQTKNDMVKLYRKGKSELVSKILTLNGYCVISWYDCAF
jgi:hypothetical protein